MNRIVEFELDAILPSQEDVLLDQGIPDAAYASDRIQALLTGALDSFARTVHPAGMISELDAEEFEPVFRGEGDNAGDVLLERIYPRADNLALFALTMGEEVSRCIEELFAENEFAPGSMLDSVASLAADSASEVFGTDFFEELSGRGLVSADHFVLGYSPGYCGWHITGQKKLFEFLEPGKIGITLGESCLMTPLKSITGLLVSGKSEIHMFEPGFEYCRSCKHRSCQERLKRLSAHKPSTA